MKITSTNGKMKYFHLTSLLPVRRVKCAGPIISGQTYGTIRELPCCVALTKSHLCALCLETLDRAGPTLLQSDVLNFVL